MTLRKTSLRKTWLRKTWLQRTWLRNRGAIGITAVGAVAFAGLLHGCSLPLSAKVLEVTNRCASDDDCNGGRCVELTCVAREADLGELIVEVEVPSGADHAPNTTHVFKPSQNGLVLSEAAGFYQFHDLLLQNLTTVNVSLSVANIPAACGGLTDSLGNVPIRIELSPTRAEFGAIPPGVTSRIYSAFTHEGASSNMVSLSVPAGSFDIYMTPLIPGDPDDQENPFRDCILPPRLISNHEIRAEEGNIDAAPVVEVTEEVVYDESAASISGSVSDFDLEGWTVALIENKKGRLMSDTFPLSLSEVGVPTPFRLSYWAENDTEDLDLVVRLIPPPELAASQGMPVFYWKLSGLPGAAASVAQLNDVSPIPVSGTVFDDTFDAPVPSILTIHSNELFLDFGENVVYRRTIETDAEGKFSDISLLPGSYTVIIQPLASDTLAVTRETLVLNQGHQGGVSLLVDPKRALNGRALTLQSAGASRVNAVLEPATPAAGTFLQNVKETLPVPPSSGSTLTDIDGFFSLLVDPGTFNLSLRPAASSDLPWTVVSSYLIDNTQGALDDVDLVIPNPVILIGQVRGGGQAIPNARIRAWLQPASSPDEKQKASAIQIAETTTLENGSYRLLLPGSLATISR